MGRSSRGDRPFFVRDWRSANVVSSARICLTLSFEKKEKVAGDRSSRSNAFAPEDLIFQVGAR